MSLPKYNDADRQRVNRDAEMSFVGASMQVGQQLTQADVINNPALGAQQKQDPLDVQVGGGHYKGKAIQPVEYISANGLNFLEGCIVKRITRWRDKNGIEDLEKIKHEVDLLIAMERKYGKN